MKTVIRWLHLLMCIGINSVLGFPGSRLSAIGHDPQTLCNDEVVRTVLDSLKQHAFTTSDLIRSQPTTIWDDNPDENTIGELVNALEDVDIDTDIGTGLLGERFGRGVELLLQKKLVDKLKSQLQTLQTECKMFISPVLRRMENAIDDANRDVFDKDTDIDEVDSIKVANVDNLENQFAEKRAKLSLNPTGWRKRRSGSTDEARQQDFLRNMRQLLEKRERRLEFNPTGW